MASRVCQRLLSTGGDKLSVSEQAALIKQITTYANERERAVRKLRLSDDKPADPWDEIDVLLSQDQDVHDDAGSDLDAEDIEDDPGADRLSGESVGDDAADDEREDLWSEVDRELARQREEE